MKNIKHKKIRNSLRKYRRARGLTQKDVARILGLKGTSMISRWENGFCVPELSNIFKLASLYCTMADGLFIDLRRSLKDDILKREENILRDKNQTQNQPEYG